MDTIAHDFATIAVLAESGIIATVNQNAVIDHNEVFGPASRGGRSRREVFDDSTDYRMALGETTNFR